MVEFNRVLKTQKKQSWLLVFLHSYHRNYVSVEDFVIENTDAPSQFFYVTTFQRFGGSASEETTRVMKKYRKYF